MFRALQFISLSSVVLGRLPVESCWDERLDREKCCDVTAGGSDSCFDAFFTRKECCNDGFAVQAPLGPADPPFKGEDMRYAVFSHTQRMWEREVANASRLLDVQLLGQSLRLRMFKSAAKDIDILIQEIQDDPYRLLQLPKPTSDNAVALDLGANIGVISVLLAKLWADKPFQLKVVSVEAAPSNYRYLLWNLRINHVWHRVLPINAAVAGQSEGQRVVHYSPFHPTSFAEDRRKQTRQPWDENTYEVPFKRISNILGSGPVHFMKVDCEGCEWDVFAPIGPWKDLQQRVHAVSTELHPGTFGDDEAGQNNAFVWVDYLKKTLPCRTYQPNSDFSSVLCSTMT